MTYLPNLIKRIDDFLKLAADPYEDYDDFDDEPAPDYSQYDDPKYQGGKGKQIEEVTPLKRENEEGEEPGEAPGEVGDPENLVMRAAQSIREYSNSNIRDELAALVSGYAVAIENPEADFYKLVLDRIKNARVSIQDNKNSDSQDDEIESAEYLCNEMEINLRSLVGKSKAPPMGKEAKEKLFAIKRKEFLTKFKGLAENIQATRQKEEDLENKGITPNVYQEEGGKGDAKKPKPLMDPGGGNRRPSNPAFERLTIKNCENEIKSLEYSIQDPRNDFFTKEISDLIETIKKIIPAIAALDEAERNFITTPDDPEAKQAEAAARLNLDQLKSQRTQLKIYLRKVQQTKSFEDAKKLAQNTTNPEEKKWLQLHADLAGLRLATTLHKTPAVNALKSLIRATGTIVKRNEAKGLQPSYFEPLNKDKPEIIRDLEAKFLAAHQEMLTKAEYDRKETEQRGSLQGREEIPVADPMRGGRREKVTKNFSQFTFAALAKEFRDQKNSAISEVKKFVVAAKPGTQTNEIPILKKYIDNVATAFRKGNDMQPHEQGATRVNPDFNTALNVLKDAVSADIRRQPFLKTYEQCLKILRVVNHIDARIWELIPLVSVDDKGRVNWNLDDSKVEAIRNLIINIKRLKNMYALYFENPAGKKYKDDVRNYFTEIMDFLDIILIRLQYEALGQVSWKKELPKTQRELNLVPTEPAKKKNKKRASSPKERMFKLALLTGTRRKHAH